NPIKEAGARITKATRTDDRNGAATAQNQVRNTNNHRRNRGSCSGAKPDLKHQKHSNASRGNQKRPPRRRRRWLKDPKRVSYSKTGKKVVRPRGASAPP
ncbi:hypothetical protein A2U01_0064618, partial [Trifolium medium]|nr:hypothetical protein [Trifolium medium]